MWYSHINKTNTWQQLILEESGRVIQHRYLRPGWTTTWKERRTCHKGPFINMGLYELQSAGIALILACPKKCHHYYHQHHQQLVCCCYKVQSSGEEVRGNLRISLIQRLDFQLRHWILPAVKWSNMFNSFWIHVQRPVSMCGYSQCPGLLLLFLKNTKHKCILNIITRCNKQ